MHFMSVFTDAASDRGEEVAVAQRSVWDGWGKETTDEQGSAQQIRSRSQHPSRILAYTTTSLDCLGSEPDDSRDDAGQAEQTEQAVIGRKALGVREFDARVAARQEQSSTSHQAEEENGTAGQASSWKG
ncbi:hypothetical protein CKAH01_08463 [Colletotrichum kahawae]|uniref:Uncharacterized protein n=1 Tax=Colletotrichum kahawae TaxID=34407 RepID=A0AAE0CZP7_COLKA|nr:hypothetical protein CKAH01_08463 [Colletotrichum kahawae]